MSRRFQDPRLSRRMPGGSAPVPTPAQILGSSLELWLRADKGIHTATGVSQWDDQSGKGDANRNVAQGTAAKQPTLNASDASYAGKPTLSFASASVQSLFSAVWVAAVVQPYTVIVIGNDDGTAANQAFTCENSAFSALVETNEGAAVGLDIYAGVQLNAGVGRSSSPRMYAGEFNGASSKTYVSSKTASATGNAGAGGILDLRVGAWTGEGSPLNGKVAEVIVASKVLSAGDWVSIAAYITSRYGIAIS